MLIIFLSHCICKYNNIDTFINRDTYTLDDSQKYICTSVKKLILIVLTMVFINITYCFSSLYSCTFNLRKLVINLLSLFSFILGVGKLGVPSKLGI